MKRFFSILSSIIVGGIIAWAIQPTPKNPNVIEHLNPNQFQSQKVVTLLDNPSLVNNPQLKKSLEDAYNNSGFKAIAPDFSQNRFNDLQSDHRSALVTRAPEATSKVECEVVYDPEVYSPSIIIFYNKERKEEFYFDYDETTWEILPYLTAELPDGEYTAYTQFWIKYSKEGIKVKDGSFVLVFEENVVLPREEKLIFDASVATNQIKYNTILPDGKMPVFDLIDPKTGEVIKTGNVLSLGATTLIIDREVGPVISQWGLQNCTNKESDEIREFDIYVNDLSERFCSYRECSIITEETAVMACQYIGNLSGDTGEVVNTNSAKDYSKLSTNICHSPAYDEIGLARNGFAFNINFTWECRNAGGMMGACQTDKDYIYFSQDSQCTPEFLLPLISVQPYDISFYIQQEDWLGRPQEILVSSSIAALPFAEIDGEIQYVNNNHSECGNFAFQKPENGSVCDYPGQPRYTFWKDQQTSLIGNNAPINSVLNEPTPIKDSPNYMNFLYPAYIGRWGEVRNVDLMFMSTQIAYNGDVVFDSAKTEEQLEQWGANWGFENHPLGTFDYYFDNKNIAVDGIPGRNYTHVFCDWQKEDKNAPVIQMLMFRNSLDEITDRFDKADDGIIEFSGGDFNYHQTFTPKLRWYFSCEPMEVKVEYSPYNQDSWSEIEVMELPEYYFMPGFGYFYRGSLASVDKMSENGWYDVKFTMTDEAGNYMEQTVSPAFKINSLTGVDKAQLSFKGVQISAKHGSLNIACDNLSAVEVYSIDGRHIYGGANKQIPLNNGAYIVKVITADNIESIHKVIL